MKASLSSAHSLQTSILCSLALLVVVVFTRQLVGKSMPYGVAGWADTLCTEQFSFTAGT